MMAKGIGRRRNGARWAIALAAAALGCPAGAGTGAAQVIPKTATATSPNPYNDALVRLTPEARAAKLAGLIGATCIGTKPFLMGITKEGRAKGYAYWSLECAGASSYMIQIAPDGEAASLDCQTVKQNGEGRECYKNF